MTRRLAPLLLLGLVAGCRSKEGVPYVGRWEGRFEVDHLNGRTQVNVARRNNWKGFLILYLTGDADLGNRCTVRLDNEQEGLDLKGHWKLRRRQISVSFNDIKIDDAGGMDVRDPNRAYIDPSDLRRAFAIPLALSIEPGGKALHSPLTIIGPLVGEFHFIKASASR